MKLIFNVCLFTLCVFINGCSKDKDDIPQAGSMNHQGEKWIISSAEYTIVDQDFMNPSQTFKSGTKENAGFFYFNGSQGSFDISIENHRKEDVFSFSENSSDINLNGIDQSAGSGTVSQNVIAFSGNKNQNGSMTISGTITKQTSSSQFVLTGTFVLVKE